MPPPRATGARRVAAGRRPWSARNLLDGPGTPWLRLAVDVVALAAALGLAVLSAAWPSGVGRTVWLFPLLVLAGLKLRGLYRRRLRAGILDMLPPVVGAISLAAMVQLAVSVVVAPPVLPTGLLLRLWVASALLVAVGRTVLTLLQRRGLRRGVLGRSTLIVGAGTVGVQIAQRLEQHREYGLRPIGFLDADPPAAAVNGAGWRLPVLGGPERLADVAALTGAEHVILAFSTSPDRGLVPLVRRCDELGLQVSLVPRLYESINERVALEHLGGLPLLQLHAVDPSSWPFALKHALDRVLAALALVALAPLMLAIAAAVKLTSPGPVLLRQRRVGRDDVAFDLLKFRSMRVPESDERSFRPDRGVAPGGVEGLDRRTPIGRWLRASSLDELPQLINVVRGEMSLVGPRPERLEFVELFRHDISRYADRHRVKSGITGWAQVSGLRGQTSLVDRVEWDNWYIENWSIWLDVKILLLTVTAVLNWRHDA